MTCAHCGQPVSDGVEACGACGTVLSPEVTQAPLQVLRSALDNGVRAWSSWHWSLRVAIVGLLLGIGGFFGLSAAESAEPGTGGFLLIFLAPLYCGAVAALARPEPFPGWMERSTEECARKRDQAAARGTVFSKWFLRPLYAGVVFSWRMTRAIRDPYLRSGTTLALQILVAYAALFAAYIAVVVVVAVIMFFFMIWLLLKVLSGNSGDSERSHRSAIAGFRPRRSELKTDFLGNEYVQHYDAENKPAGRTEKRTDWLGHEHSVTLSESGEEIGHSESHEGFLGGRYVQHYDAHGDKAGTSHEKEGFFGNRYVEHRSEDGGKAGRSEIKQGSLGNAYIEHSES
jgi:hypothetical protein